MATLRIIGFVAMFVGIGLKLAELPGYTTAFIIGAIFILIPRLYQLFNFPRRS